MCMVVLSACMSVYHMYLVPVEARNDVRSQETGVTDVRDTACGCWEA